MRINISQTPKKWLAFGGVAIVSVVGVLIYLYESYYYPSTDDAYANANVVYISAQVQGQVDKVMVIDHQTVKANDLLFTLDKTPFIAAYHQAEAQLKSNQQQVLVDQAAIKVAQANLAESQANEVLAAQQAKRILALVKQGYASKEQGDENIANLKAMQAQVQSNKAAILQAQQNLTVQKAQVTAAEANLKTAATNLTYTEVYTPVDGIVANITLRPGAIVTPGINLFAVIDTAAQSYWVDANFKETQLKRIRPGQEADVVFDMYPGVTFHGVVQSISGGSGAAFALLPAENATGNWVKVTQRFPVRVIIPPEQLKADYPIRVGATALVTVDTMR